MFKYAKLTLLTLAAFLLLGFSITANAGKPDTNQLIMSAPLRGGAITCEAANLTDETLAVTFTLYGPDGASTTLDPNPRLIDAGKVDGWVQFYTPSNYMYCTVEWFGSAGAVRATSCSFVDTARHVGIGCVELF